MNFWGIVWRERKGDLVKVPPDKRAEFLIAVISSALEMLGSRWRSGLKGRNRRLFEQCERACRNATKVDAASFEEFEELVEEEQYPGFYDIGTAVIIFLRGKGAEFNAEQMRDVLGYCYQAVLNVEIISKIERSMIEDEVILMEKNNVRCAWMIDKQVELLREFQMNK